MPQPSQKLGFFMCAPCLLTGVPIASCLQPLLDRIFRGLRMWEELGKAFCLMLVLEGIIPFLYPTRWRHLAASLAQISDRQLRIMGLMSMLIGVGLLYLLK